MQSCQCLCSNTEPGPSSAAPPAPHHAQDGRAQQPTAAQNAARGSWNREGQGLLQVLMPAQVQQSRGERPMGVECAVPLFWAGSVCALGCTSSLGARVATLALPGMARTTLEAKDLLVEGQVLPARAPTALNKQSRTVCTFGLKEGANNI